MFDIIYNLPDVVCTEVYSMLHVDICNLWLSVVPIFQGRFTYRIVLM